jgi:hypothetical protein
MMHISPGFRSSIDKFQSSIVEDKNVEGGNQIATQNDEVHLINAFFTHIHCITPIVDEENFRSKYAQGGDQQSPWLALLNMVLAIGSVSTSEPDETSQKIFYARAYENLSLDSLGNGHLETIQALGLLGGYFCHYLNQPNMANVILGAALRMALAMGLHREPASRAKELSGLHNWATHETRRRVWWCLFCLDTWASLTLGRPSLGRWDQETITVNLPSSSVCGNRVFVLHQITNTNNRTLLAYICGQVLSFARLEPRCKTDSQGTHQYLAKKFSNSMSKLSGGGKIFHRC